MATHSSSIAFIGFGEAACAFLEGWALDDPARITAYDIKTDQADTRQSLLDRYRQHGVTGCATAAAAVAQAEVVFSLVTGDCAHAAARTAAPSLRAGALWFDCNSCASDTKKAAAADIEAANARYVDVAVMAPVLPQRHRVPLLISGPHTEDALSVLQSLGMRPEATGDTVGQASSIKMLRSVMVKGIEALCAECLIAARRAGVEDQVIASLNASATQRDFGTQASYNMERMMVHGIRRAAEMREVAITVAALGLPADMATATAAWQDRIGQLGLDAGDDHLIPRLDHLSAMLRHVPFVE
ncbi:DUF1932 domain-containing protein [Xanthomonas oryzae]|uniref:DUF1932 domain-containing protein n=1 Tax=Xanthomonas oryzae TaxID=347 RepID=UPI00129AA57F|nr:NAD(P)-dependent oxidoreductase [Xanthomonas oryzae]MEC5079132.1 DUF1932 domain-containing protein [Xanthomonas oryzae pv. oryzicola]MEC5114578.1 DUF1932 domain-containing protein [Xanthomonas oryzae pv. oryzicola]QGH67559.1 DUF1932 domain-containing protein [Xanthomonas oryzae pv. oryzicola]